MVWFSGRARSAVIALAASFPALVACPDDGKRPLGATCRDDSECTSGLCAESVCLDPTADDDLDSLVNRLEVNIGTSPRQADSDGDGERDRDELAADLTPLDSDGDALIDALESAIADADEDCLNDEVDPLNDTPDATACSPMSDLVPRDCEAYRVLGHGSGPSIIDPDGVGGSPELEVDCLQDVERGGWTPLVERYLPFAAQAPHEYLLVAGSDWYRTPIMSGGWSWDAGRAAVGSWLWQAAGTEPAGILSVECPGETLPEGAIGLGCQLDGTQWLYVDGTAPFDRQLGSVRLCAAGSAPNFIDGCTETRVYARRVRCLPDAGSIVGDGGFAQLGAPDVDGVPGVGEDACWLPELEGANTLSDVGEHAPGDTLPALRVSGAGAWRGRLVQRQRTLVAGHAYRIGFWVRGDVKLTRWSFELEGGVVDFFFDEVPIDTGWRRYERGLVAKGNQVDASVAIALEAGVGAAVHVAGLRIEDLGRDYCTPASAAAAPGGEAATSVVSGDAGFAGGLACWTLDHETGLALWPTGDEATPPPEGEEAPGLAVERPAIADGVQAMLAQAVNVRDDRWYRMEGWFASERAGDQVTLGLGVAEESRWTFVHDVLIGPAWQRLERDFVIPSGTSGIGRFEAKLGPTAGGTLRLDGIGLRDMGPSPCAAPAAPELLRDGELRGGTACWDVEIRVVGAGSFAHEALDAAPGTSAPSLRFSGTSAALGPIEAWEIALIQHGFALTGGAAYQLRFWARADADASFLAIVHNLTDFTQSYFQEVSVTTGWSEYVFDFNAAQDEADAALELQLGTVASPLWIDGVSLLRGSP